MKNVSRVVISTEADKSLDDLLLRVTTDFDTGEITRTDIVNWILLNSKTIVTDNHIKAIRTLHFDRLKVLDLYVRKAKEAGEFSQDLEDMLLNALNMGPKNKRKTA